MPITRDTPYRDIGPVPYDLWRSKIIAAGGRAELASRNAWVAAGNFSGVLLRILDQESSFDSNYAANSPGNNNPYNIRVLDRSNEGNPRGYVAYPNLVQATDAAMRRIRGDAGFFQGPNPYALTETIEDLLYTYAPPKWNDTEGLIRKMVDALNAWLPNWSPPVTTPSTPEIPVEGEPVATPATLDYSSLSFPVETRLIPASQTNQRTGLAMTPAYTTWHDTDNKGRGANAESHARWMAEGCPDQYGRPTQTSWHFSVDDGKAIQHIPLNEVAWHAGDGYNGPGNRTSIAIEECVNSDRDAAKTRKNAAELHAFLIKSLKLQGGTVNALVQHNRWSGKDCPASIRAAGLWPSVVAQVSTFLAAGGGTTPTYADAHPVERGSRIVNDHQFLAPGGKTFKRDTIPAEWGDGKDNPTGPVIKKGTTITQDNISHYVQGTDGNLYLVLTGVAGVKDGSRVPAEAVIA